MRQLGENVYVVEALNSSDCYHKIVTLNTTAAGLIDVSYNVRFCIQYSEVLDNLYLSDGNLVSIQEYESLLARRGRRRGHQGSKPPDEAEVGII